LAQVCICLSSNFNCSPGLLLPPSSMAPPIEDLQVGSPMSSSPSSNPSKRQRKCLEFRGAKGGLRPELDGVYRPMQDFYTGACIYRNGRTNVILSWRSQMWCATPNPNSTEIFAYIGASASSPDVVPPPCQVQGCWTVVGKAQGGADPFEQEEPAIECIFRGQTLVVSGRCGHNERLNGVYAELFEDYAGYPAYVDKQKHLFIYRRSGSPCWVISNRLGPSIRSGHGIVFAELASDVAEPHLVKGPWVVSGWGQKAPEEDPNITIFPRAADGGTDAPPPMALSVTSRLRLELIGEYSLVEGRSMNDFGLYRRPKQENQSERFIFWDGECWCIAGEPGLSRRECDVVCQKRQVIGRNHPDDAVWPSVEVLRASKGNIDAQLLGMLRGRTSAIAKQFS